MSNTAFFRIQVDGADKLEADLTQLTQKANELKAQKQQLNKELKNLDTSSANYSKRSQELNNQLAKTDIELKEVNADLRQSQKAYFDSATATEKASGSINQLRAQLRKAQKSYDDLSKEQRENDAIGGKQLKTIQKLDAELKELEGSTGRNQRNVGNYGQAVNGLLPIMGTYGSQLQLIQMQVGQVTASLRAMTTAQKAQAASTSKVSKALKIFRIALISTGIGAIVVALGSLVAAFASTQKGIDAINSVLRPLRVLFGRVLDFLQKTAIKLFEDIGEAIDNPAEAWENFKQTLEDGYKFIKDVVLNPLKATFSNAALLIEKGILKMRIAWNEFTGDAEEAKELEKELKNVNKEIEENLKTLQKGQERAEKFAQSISDSFDRVVEGAREALNLGSQIDQLTKDIEQSEIDQLTRQANLRVIREKNLALSKDQTLDDKTRLEALSKAENAQNQLLAERENILRKRIELKKLENSVNDTSREDLKEQKQLEADLITLVAENERKRATIISQRSAIELRAINKKKAEEKKAIEEQRKAEEKAIEEKKKAEEKAIEEKKKANEDLNSYILNLEQERLFAEIDDKRQAELKKLEITREAKKQEILDSLASEEKKQQALTELELQYEREKNKIDEERKKEEEEQTKEVREASIDSAQQLANTFVDITKTRSDRQKEVALANLNSQLEQGLINQEQFEKKREQIERKAFQQQKRADIAQAVINGAVAFTKALTRGPIVGPILAGTVAAQTAAQVGLIATQKFAEGGFTGDGFGSPDSTGYKVAGVVHENEYVVPERLINEPEVMSLERKRLSTPSIAGLRGFANGGFTSQPANVTLDSQGLQQEIIAGVSQSLSQIRVVNVATDTSNQSDRVKQIQNINTF